MVAMPDIGPAKPTRPTRTAVERPAAVSVWPTGRTDLAGQLAAGHYLPASRRDTAAIPPDVAAYAIGTYSRPGDTVLDPDCGAGTVVVEAVRGGRHVIGVAGRRWWPTARANLNAAKTAGATADGMVLDARPPDTPTSSRTHRRTGSQTRTATQDRTAAPSGSVDLVLTAVRTIDNRRGPDPSPSPSPDPDLYPGPGRRPTDIEGRVRTGLRALLDRSVAPLRPGGHLVLLAGPLRRNGGLVDLPAAVAETARRAGLIPVDRCVAPTAPAAAPELAGRQPDRHARPSVPLARVAHLDVYVFLRPDTHDAASRAASPAPLHAPGPRPAEAQTAPGRTPDAPSRVPAPAAMTGTVEAGRRWAA
jgi:modification methylase